tara:strand:+ start:6250 stop:7038 length:789 start_codon:yes stop_codon:yes gene_type:complete
MSELAEKQEPQAEESGSLLGVQIPDTDSEKPQDMPHFEGEAEAVNDAEVEWGDRPEWMPDNFWSDDDGPDMEGLAKSYQEMRTKMSQGLHKAPKDGNYDMANLKDAGVENDDPMLSDFTSFAKESGMSQDQFTKLTNMYMQHMGDQMDTADTNREVEMAKLGPKADKIIGGLNTWLGKYQASGSMTESEVNAITGAATNADFISAMTKIRSSYGEQVIPDVNIQESQQYTRVELDQMVGDPRYKTDPVFREKVEGLFMEMYN